eukprot:4895438-Amphidinium_carterae.1
MVPSLGRSITHHLNRLFALHHGYRFRRPEMTENDVRAMLADSLTEVHGPRRVQWSIARDLALGAYSAPNQRQGIAGALQVVASVLPIYCRKGILY